jgi:hypothetical protein
MVSFLIVYMTISFTQSTHSTPSKKASMFNTMTINLGPPPNSTGISLDTTITIDTTALATLNNLQITPETPINHIESITSGPLTYENIIYPAQPLEPSTAYTVSVDISDVPVIWTFTTTSEILEPGIGFTLVKNVLGISLAVGVLATLILGLVIWFKKGKVDE